MAKKKKKKVVKKSSNTNKKESKKSKSNKSENNFKLKQEVVEAIIAILFILIAIFLAFAAFEKAGFLGILFFEWLTNLFGVGYYFLPFILIGLGISFLSSLKNNPAIAKVVGGIVIFVCILGLIGISFDGKSGMIGSVIANPLKQLLGAWVASVSLIAALLITIVIEFNLSLKFNWKELLMKLFSKKNREELKEGKGIDEEDEIKTNLDDKEDEEESNEQKDEQQVEENNNENSQNQSKTPETPQEQGIPAKSTGLVFFSKKANQKFTPPPISLLQKDSGKPGVGDVKANANMIKRTLANFGIQVEMDEVSIGPTVTRYALKPAEGVKLAKIVSLQNDLALALAAHPLRIEAPIPGKSLVGIEIPNATKTTVGLGSLFKDPAFNDPNKPLNVCLGKGITGISHFANLAKMPHGLIAGATGSGKSVTIHALITSLLYRNHPDQLKFIMVDPKRVELTLYNDIPHLLTPVITDAKKAILSLKWAGKEMDRRYDILEENSVRDIGSYHKNIVQPALKTAEASGDEETELPEPMPYIVIVIDEMADLMQAFPRELEAGIVRLAQMSRAVGIHLLISTQRPSVNVVTGLIKANIPTRVALQVASQIDSKTILDMQGAEKLLGAGDLLYLSGEKSQPTRIQSAFISEDEVKSVVDWLKNHYQDEVNSGSAIDLSPGSENRAEQTENGSMLAAAGGFDGFDSADENEEDELYSQAKETVIEAGKASTSYIQRKLRVGYARAARLMDMLEERGVIGPADGSKPRPILVEQQKTINGMAVEEDGSLMGNVVDSEDKDDEEEIDFDVDLDEGDENPEEENSKF